MSFKRVAATVGALLSVTALAACSVDGTPTRGPIDLDTGKYSTTLNAPAGNATTDGDKARLKAAQLAEYLVFRDDLDPALVQFSMPTYPVSAQQGLAGVFSKAGDLPTTKKLQYGFSVGGGADDKDPSKKGVNYAVFVYDSPQTASEAVNELTDNMLGPDGGGAKTKVTIPGMPSTTVAVAGKSFDKTNTIAAGLTPVGASVIYTWADSVDPQWPAQTVRAGYEKQKALLDSMPPISDSTELDPSGLLRAVIPPDANAGLPSTGQVLGPRAISQFTGASSKNYRDYEKAGVVRAAIGGAVVFETGSDGQATELAKTVGDSTDDPMARKADSPRDLSSAVCSTSKSSFGSDTATCVIAVGKYLVDVDGTDLLDVQQRTSAEYALLKQL